MGAAGRSSRTETQCEPSAPAAQCFPWLSTGTFTMPLRGICSLPIHPTPLLPAGPCGAPFSPLDYALRGFFCDKRPRQTKPRLGRFLLWGHRVVTRRSRSLQEIPMLTEKYPKPCRAQRRAQLWFRSQPATCSCCEHPAGVGSVGSQKEASLTRSLLKTTNGLWGGEQGVHPSLLSSLADHKKIDLPISNAASKHPRTRESEQPNRADAENKAGAWRTPPPGPAHSHKPYSSFSRPAAHPSLLH